MHRPNRDGTTHGGYVELTRQKDHRKCQPSIYTSLKWNECFVHYFWQQDAFWFCIVFELSFGRVDGYGRW